jgi:hypothetical protein
MIDPSLLVATTGFVDYIEGDPKYLTIADLERAQGIPRKIRSAIRHYVAGTTWPGLDLEKVAYDWKKLSKAIAAYDPEDEPRMEKLLSGLPDVIDISAGYIGALQKVVQYVSDQMPHNADAQMTGIRQRDPAGVDIYRWGRCVTVAEEPLYVLQWIHEGRLTGHAVDCLTAMYPAILEMMTSEIVQALAEQTIKGGWVLPREKERQLALILGSFAAPGLQQAIQSMLGDEAQGQASKSPSSAAGSRVAKTYHSISKED